MVSFIDFLQQHMLTCPSKALLHRECPGCGMQRSIIYLLKGELVNSFRVHPAGIPMVVLLLFAASHLVFKFRKGARVIVFFQVLVAILMVAFYIYKIVNHKIFI